MANLISRFQLNSIIGALVSFKPTVGSQNFLGFGVSAPSYFAYSYLHNNILLDSGGFTDLGTGGPGSPTLNASGLPTVAATLYFYSRLSTGESNVAPGNYWLNVPSTGQTVTASVVGAAGTLVLGTGVPQGDGVTIRYPLQVVGGITGGGGLNFTGQMSDFPSLSRTGSVNMTGVPVFADAALAHYSQQPILRLMDLMTTNGAGGEGRADTTASTAPADWALNAYRKPFSWQKMVAFANAVAAYPGSRLKKLYINIPPYCDDGYVTFLANLITSLGLTSAIQLYVQRANEQWNNAFICWATYRSNALTELNYLDNYASGSPSTNTIQSVTSDGTKLTFTTLNPIGSYLTTTAPCVVVGNVGGFNVGTRTAPVTATKTGANTFTVPSTGSASGGQFGVIFNLASSLIADDVLPDAYHCGSKWYTRRLYRDWQLWNAVRPQDRFYLDTQKYGAQTAFGNGSSQIEFGYAAYLAGGDASTWLYGAALGYYVVPTTYPSSPTTVDGVVADLTAKINGEMDGFARGHSYMCRKMRIKPLAYEGGFETGIPSNLLDAFMADPRAATLTALTLDKWYGNGCEDFNYYYGSPDPNLTYAALKTYADTTSQKYLALQAYQGKQIAYANIHGSGPDITLDIVGYFQFADNRVAILNGLLGWYDTPPNYVDVDVAIATAGNYRITLKGAAGIASTIGVFLDPSLSSNGTSLGTSTIRVANSGFGTAGPSDALAVLDPITTTLTAGVHTLRFANPQRTNAGGIGLLNARVQLL